MQLNLLSVTKTLLFYRLPPLQGLAGCCKTKVIKEATGYLLVINSTIYSPYLNYRYSAPGRSVSVGKGAEYLNTIALIILVNSEPKAPLLITKSLLP